MFTSTQINGAMKTRRVKGTIRTLDCQMIPFSLRNVVVNDDVTDLGVTRIVLNKSVNQAGRSFEIKAGKPRNFAWRLTD